MLVVEGERVAAGVPAACRRREEAIERRASGANFIAPWPGRWSEGPLRTMHLALASTREWTRSSPLKLVAAANEASARGGRQQAVEMARHALRLTPAESDSRGERVLALADVMYEAGELRRLTKLLSQELESLPTGAMRARARLLLGEGYGSRSLDDTDDQLELALVEAGDDPALRAYLLAKRAANTAAGRVARMGDAEAWALEALRGCGWAGGRASRAVRAGVGSTR